MKLLRRRTAKSGQSSFVFHLGKRDRDLLLSVLKLFPVADVADHRLSKTGDDKTRVSQPLLTDAMRDQQREDGKRIEALFAPDQKIVREKDGEFQLVLKGEQMEWLLRALNDIRVGSWMKLGCPEMEAARQLVKDETTAVHYTAMELSGYFQATLLQAFQPDEQVP